MRNPFFLIAAFAAAFCCFSSGTVYAQQNQGPVSAILNHYAAANYTAGDIPRADLERILQAGIRSPSARNRQPWHFTVVENRDLARQLVPNILDGNILVVVSARGDGKTNGGEILDCALAVQSIYLAAQALGYGSRIYTGPMDKLNRDMKSSLSLPGGHSAVALVRIGKVPAGVDAVSAASGRKKAADLITYKR